MNLLLSYRRKEREELFHTKREHSSTFKDTVGLEQEPCV